METCVQYRLRHAFVMMLLRRIFPHMVYCFFFQVENISDVRNINRKVIGYGIQSYVRCESNC